MIADATKLQEVREQILSSEDFVLSELRRIQYTYTLKHVIRYGIDRTEEYETESVAEHIYGLHVLADYFLPLEDVESTMNLRRVHDLIQYHDIDEIETGDIVSYLKTDKDREEGKQALSTVFERFPSHLQSFIRDLLAEYEAQETPEARFVKALDKMEPTFHSYTEAGKSIFQKNGQTIEQHLRIKEPYVKTYPILRRFHEVTTVHMEKDGYFLSE